MELEENNNIYNKKLDIIYKICYIANRLDDVALELEYYGGFAKWAGLGRDFRQIATTLRQRAVEINK